VPEAIARLNEAGFDVAICTNQPEIACGILSQEQLNAIHEALEHMLAARNARVDLIICCGYDHKCPQRKPAAGMLREALARHRAIPGETPFSTPDASECWSAPIWAAKRWSRGFRSIFRR
jgi:D-glycero-D-manno-heptose 1,7-bisphosphate phosphatase